MSYANSGRDYSGTIVPLANMNWSFKAHTNIRNVHPLQSDNVSHYWQHKLNRRNIVCQITVKYKELCMDGGNLVPDLRHWTLIEGK